MYLIYLINIIVLIAGVKTYFTIANKFNIVDEPNVRSSHSTIILRGGGIVFYLGALLWFFQSGFQYPWFYIGLTGISLISFVDDIMSVPNWLRLISHIIAILFIFYQLDLFSGPLLYLIIALFVSTGVINAYNFMDGINGITGVYSLVVISCFWFINNYITSFVQNDFIHLIGIAILIFNFYNTRVRAKCFAGDIGSISIAFILLFLLWKLIIVTGDLSFFILLAVYGVDPVLTIIHRLILGENIFDAHRKHLYQLLANEGHIPHVVVACSYAFLQLILFVGYIFLYDHDIMIRFIYLFSVFLILSIIYLFLIKKYYRLHDDNKNVCCDVTDINLTK